MRVPECQFIFIRILKMRNENFSSFSFFISVENWKEFNLQPIFQNSFFIFLEKWKRRFFDFFFQILEKFKFKFNEFKEIEILFLSSLFKFEKKIHLLTFFPFFLLALLFEMTTMSSVRSRSAIFAAEATIKWLEHLQVVDRATTLKEEWKLNSRKNFNFHFFSKIE